MTRLDKLNECLSIARKHGNTFMEQNILKEISKESEMPSTHIYKDPTSDDSTT
jgi:hypothetical protein